MSVDEWQGKPLPLLLDQRACCGTFTRWSDS